MKPRVPSFLLIAALALWALSVATGCRSLVPFTQELRDQNRLTEADLRNLQYYVSSTITLRRELDSTGRQVTGNHKLLVLAGKTIEEVVVESKTPGICVGTGPHGLSISFEQGTSLDFTPLSGRAYASDTAGFASPPSLDPFPGNHAEGPRGGDLFSGAYTLSVSPQNTVHFLGRAFDATGDTARATLLIDAESLDQVVKQRKVLPGLRLPSK